MKKKKEIRQFSILTQFYNKEGINDGVNFQVVDDRFRTISNHRTKRNALKKVRQLNKKQRLK